jgi:hypothetical protein
MGFFRNRAPFQGCFKRRDQHRFCRPIKEALAATAVPIRQLGVVAFAARRAKELGADAITVLSH